MNICENQVQQNARGSQGGGGGGGGGTMRVWEGEGDQSWSADASRRRGANLKEFV